MDISVLDLSIAYQKQLIASFRPSCVATEGTKGFVPPKEPSRREGRKEGRLLSFRPSVRPSEGRFLLPVPLVPSEGRTAGKKEPSFGCYAGREEGTFLRLLRRTEGGSLALLPSLSLSLRRNPFPFPFPTGREGKGRFLRRVACAEPSLPSRSLAQVPSEGRKGCSSALSI
jgi:hypothetical protein